MLASSSSAARQIARQPIRKSEPNVPVAFNPQYQTLHEHPDDIRPVVYEATHPLTGFIVEYMVDRPSFTSIIMAEVYRTIFREGKRAYERLRESMPIAKALHNIITENVNSRNSDPRAVRTQD
ncbi:unnamed protein product [Lactuca saligna]|uniref:Uncharacterized protein n=1 Tax=Lactuca saligna TaxID=75948 RepID=A0AA35YD76_LACSI|nr:unnamed protein product [Lactuca saligna]